MTAPIGGGVLAGFSGAPAIFSLFQLNEWAQRARAGARLPRRQGGWRTHHRRAALEVGPFRRDLMPQPTDHERSGA
jgi:hypothetical protein